MSSRSILILFLAISGLVYSVPGGVVFEGAVFSQILQTNRTVRIYLPPSYEVNTNKHYPVLYLHDGQNVFSTAGPHVAFGWGNWALDTTVNALGEAGRIREIIMVAVDCTAERYLDYRGPALPVAGTNTSATAVDHVRRPGDDSRYDGYRRFLIDELKPKIDREYRTLADAKHTGIMGSSMGGICSLALAWQHPNVFGCVASVSGAYQVEKGHFLKDVLEKYDGEPKAFRIYLDSGVTDFTGGDDGHKDTEAVVKALRRIGWKDNINLLHYVDKEPLSEEQMENVGLRKDKWKEARTSQHNEFYWKLRAWRPLEFLFPPEKTN